jgi:hypothetical protein
MQAIRHLSLPRIPAILIGMKILALILAFTATASAEKPANNMHKQPEGRMTICLAPWGCGGTGKGMLRKPPAGYDQRGEKIKEQPPIKEEHGDTLRDAPSDIDFYTSQDPLAKRDRGITSAIRLDPEETGNEAQVLVIQHGPDLALPTTTVPAPKKSPTSEVNGEWADELAGDGEAAQHVNRMRNERDEITGSAGDATEAGQRMYGDKVAQP